MPDQSDAESQPASAVPARRRRPWWQIAGLLILTISTVAAIPLGISLRRNAFDWSSSIHHTDLYAARARGEIAHRAGIFETYEKIASGRINMDRYGIDYAPLRLTAITSWVRWLHDNHPNEPWRGDYEQARPLLTANTVASLVSSMLVFLLVRLWVRRSVTHISARLDFMTGAAAGMSGATLFWFNPAIIWDGHCWPQWDVWLMPFFLSAVLLASIDCWFFAAVCVVTAAFFKGQILLVAPLLVMWPLFQLRFGAVLRFFAGCFATAAVLALPWMGIGSGGLWLVQITLAVGVVAVASFWRIGGNRAVAVWIAIALVLGWAWMSAASLSWRAASLAPAAIACLVFILPGKRWLTAIAGSFGTAILLLMPLFDARTAWYTVGFEYGTHKFPNLASAVGTYSIPTILRDYFNWPDNMETPVGFFGYECSIRFFMFGIFGISLLLCSIAAAVHDRRRDPRFLLAAITPWVCFFSLLTQMNNRYLVWGAVLTSLLSGVSVGLTLLGLLLSVICVVGMAQHMLPMDRSFAPDMTSVVQSLQTHLAWPVALIAMIFLYSTVAPALRRSRVGPKLMPFKK
ncbi:MAG: hypothetical protein H7144_14485 [Burkholderiales bacterium]|nr:hypothetical protein [Phycisphaerae bacterium]